MGFTNKMNRKNVYFSILILFLLLITLFLHIKPLNNSIISDSTLNFYSGTVSDHYKNKVLETPTEEFSREDTILERITKLETKCGDLCNTAKNIQPGDFLGTVKSDIDCKGLFNLLESFTATSTFAKPKTWTDIPLELRNKYNYNERVRTASQYKDDTNLGSKRNEAKVFSLESIQKELIQPWLNNTDVGAYPGAGKLVEEVADIINVTGKTILVIGTQIPWIEIILLIKNPKKIVTLEYGHFVSEHPHWTFIRPKEFQEKYLDGTLETFDIVFSFSSVEHSGLGRYGDPLNPWGDIMTVAEAWCVSSPQAKLVLSVPTDVQPGKDVIFFNTHRVYGPILYPFLTTNWKYTWPQEEKKRTRPAGLGTVYQPLFLFEKNHLD